MSKFDSILKDLKSSNPRIVFKALVDVRSRVSKNKDDIRELLARGLVPQLLQILRCQKATGSKSSLAPVNVCLSLLGNLFTEFDGRKSITQHTAARDIPIICRFLQEGEDPGLLNRCVRALANLSLDKSNMATIVQEGAVTRLAELMEKTEDPDCEQTYIRACRLFWSVPTARSSLVESGVPQVVARLLAESPNPAVQHASLRTLAEMLKFECGEIQARQLLQGSMMDRLVAWAKQECDLDSERPEQPESGGVVGSEGKGGKEGAASTDDPLALEVLLLLMQNDHLRHAVGAAGGVTFFIDFVRDRVGHPKFKAILNALCLCAKDSVNRVKIREGGGLGLYLRCLESPALASLHDRVLSGLLSFIYDEASLRLLLEDTLVPCLITHLHRCAQVTPSLHQSLWAAAKLQGSEKMQEDQAGEDGEGQKSTESLMKDLPDSVTKWLGGAKSAFPDLEEAADDREMQGSSSQKALTVPSQRGPEVEKLEAEILKEVSGGHPAMPSEETMLPITSTLDGKKDSCREALLENDSSVQQGDNDCENDKETDMSVASEITQEKCTASSASPSHFGDEKGASMEGMEALEDTMEEVKNLEDMVQEMEHLETEEPQPQERPRFSIHSPTYQAASEWTQETFSSGAKCKSDFSNLGLPPSPEAPLSPLSHSTLYSPASVSSSHWSPATSPHSPSSPPSHSPLLSSSPEHYSVCWSPVAACPADSEEETEVMSTADPFPTGQSDASPSSCQQTMAAAQQNDSCQPVLSECTVGEEEGGDPSCVGSKEETSEMHYEVEQNVGSTPMDYSVQKDSPPFESENLKQEYSETERKQSEEVVGDAKPCSSPREEEPNETSPRQEVAIVTDNEPQGTTREEGADETSAMQGVEMDSYNNTCSMAREEDLEGTPTTGDSGTPTKRRHDSGDSTPPSGYLKRFRLAEEFSRKKALREVERKSRKERRQMGAAEPWKVLCGVRQAANGMPGKANEGTEAATCSEKKGSGEGSGSKEGKPLSRTERIRLATESNITQLLSALSQRDSPGDNLAKPQVISGILDYLAQAESPALRCVRALVRVFQDLHGLHALMTMGAPLMVLETLLVAPGGHLATLQNLQDAFLMEGKELPRNHKHMTYQRHYRHWSAYCMQGGWPSKDSPPQFHAVNVVLTLLDELQVACQTSFGRNVIIKALRSGSYSQRLTVAISLLTLAWTKSVERFCVKDTSCWDLVKEHLRKDWSPTSPWLRAIALTLAVLFRIPRRQYEVLEENPPPPFPYAPCSKPPSPSPDEIDPSMLRFPEALERYLNELRERHEEEQEPGCQYEKARPQFDLTLVCEGGEVGARRDLLVEGSQVFAAMLEGHYRETHQSCVQLQDTSVPALTLLLHFLHGCGSRCPSLKPVLWHKPRIPDSPFGGRKGLKASRTASTTCSAAAEQNFETKAKDSNSGIPVDRKPGTVSKDGNGGSPAEQKCETEGDESESPAELEMEASGDPFIKSEDSQDAKESERESVSTSRTVRFMVDKPRPQNKQTRQRTDAGGRPGQDKVQEEEEGVGLILDLMALADRYALAQLTSYLQAALETRNFGPGSLLAVLLWGEHYHCPDLSGTAVATWLTQVRTVDELCHTFHKLLASKASRELFLHTLDALMHKPLVAGARC